MQVLTCCVSSTVVLEGLYNRTIEYVVDTHLTVHV